MINIDNKNHIHQLVANIGNLIIYKPQSGLAL